MAYNYHRVCLLHLFAYSLLLGGRPAACLRADGDRPASVTFHVAERGKDSWSGNIPAPNADGTDGPFATPSRARDAARLLRATDRAGSLRRGDVVIFVHAGRYELAEPLVFAPEDSGTAESRTVFAAAPEDQGRVVVSGGRAVAGWKAAPGPHGEWVADLPGLKDGWRFCYVSVDGQWRGRPRLPDGETATYTMAGLAGADPKAPYDTPADRFEYARDQIDPLDRAPRRRSRRRPLLGRFPLQDRRHRTRPPRREARPNEPAQVHGRASAGSWPILRRECVRGPPAWLVLRELIIRHAALHAAQR